MIHSLPIAYMDPGAGSLLLQVILGGVAGLAVFLKLFWHRLTSLLGIAKPPAVEKTEIEEAPAADAGGDLQG